LRAISQILDSVSLHETGILLEYQLPQTSRRIDCLFCGEDASGVANAVVVELKQWDKTEPSDADWREMRRALEQWANDLTSTQAVVHLSTPPVSRAVDLFEARAALP